MVTDSKVYSFDRCCMRHSKSGRLVPWFSTRHALLGEIMSYPCLNVLIWSVLDQLQSQ